MPAHSPVDALPAQQVHAASGGVADEALGDQVVDLAVVQARRINPHLGEEAVDLQADEAVQAGPGGQAKPEVPGCGNGNPQ